MPVTFLDLLGQVLGPALSGSETARLRRLLDDDRRAEAEARDRPWESGVPEVAAKAQPVRSEAEDLRYRVLWLELGLKVLCDMLAEAGVVDGAALAERLRTIERQVADARAEMETTVVCASCGTRVPREECVVRATGILCMPCHTGRPRPAAPPGPVEGLGGYREAPRAAPVEETVTCVGCATTIARRASYQSARGVLCQRCYVATEE